MTTNRIRGVRLINALVKGRLGGAALEELLGDADRKASFATVLACPGEQERLTAAPVALRELALSLTAYGLLPEAVRRGVLEDGTAIQHLTATLLGENPQDITFADIADFVDDEAVMQIVFASEPACDVMFSSQTALDALVQSAPGMTGLCGSQTALDTLAKKQGQKELEDIATTLLSTETSRRALAAVTDARLKNRLFEIAVNSGDYEAFRYFVEQLGMQESAEFLTEGTHSLTVPDYVTCVHVLCVGSGGYGGKIGGGGGGLAWSNQVEVLPGQTLEVVVGAATAKTTEADTFWTQCLDVKAGNGAGGDAATSPGRGGGFTGNGGGAGGDGGTSYGGGGGAGGYTGSGGRGGNGHFNNGSGNGYSGGSGSGGGGGGGTGCPSNNNYGAGGGGGVGLYGAGSSGSGGTADTNAATYAQNRCGKGGSGGENGSVGKRYVDGGAGGSYGGGGGAGFGLPGKGGPGAVRIIWGASRAFPSTHVEKL